MHAGTASFAQPNEASRKLVMESKSVSLKGKKFAIEPLLRPATLKLSLLLVRVCTRHARTSSDLSTHAPCMPMHACMHA
jgi:hypothetical protein